MGHGNKGGGNGSIETARSAKEGRNWLIKETAIGWETLSSPTTTDPRLSVRPR